MYHVVQNMISAFQYATDQLHLVLKDYFISSCMTFICWFIKPFSIKHKKNWVIYDLYFKTVQSLIVWNLSVSFLLHLIIGSMYLCQCLKLLQDSFISK